MLGTQEIGLSQHDLWDFTLYRSPARSTDCIKKPLYPHIGKWMITGVLQRSDCCETSLAENIKTGKPAVLSYLIPRIEFDCLSEEYEKFLKVGAVLAGQGRVRFTPEAIIKKASRQVRGFRTTITGSPNRPTAEYSCSACKRELSASAIDGIHTVKDFYRCVCGNQIRMKYVGITVPAMIQKYKDQISLKRSLITAKANDCLIPNLIFCRLIGLTVQHLRRVKSMPILISSRAIALCADGTTSYVYTPAGRSKKFHDNDIPAHVARFFEVFLSCCPDVSYELGRFIALPNRKTLRGILQIATNSDRAHLRDWLSYVTAAGRKDDRQADYSAVQALLLPEGRTQASLDQVLSAADVTLHPGMVTLSDLQEIQALEDRRKKRGEERTAKKNSWERYLQPPPESPRSVIARLRLILASIPVWQKYASAGICAMAILFTALFSIASIGPAREKDIPDTKAVLRSSPARILKDNIPAPLQERIGNTVATVRVLISETGRVNKIEWVYATDEQRASYTTGLEYVNFKPAQQNGSPTESWQTIQLPIREKDVQ